MKQIKSIITRIRWDVVFGILSAILIVLLLAVVFIFIRPLEAGYKGNDEIRIRSWADPSAIKLNDKSTVWIDIRNTGLDTLTVYVVLRSHDPNLIFADTDNQTINKKIVIGPRESRQPKFPVKINTELSGDYGIEITVSYAYDQIEDEVILNVLKS